MQINVKGGTNAGWRKAQAHIRLDWKCPACSSKNRYYWVNCPGCGHPRD